MKKKSIQFYLVARKAVRGSVMHFTGESRLQILNEYWGLSKTIQMEWLSHSIDT